MFKKIAITGGPCSGKTTGLAYLSERLLDFGYRPLIIPEIPTLVISGGVQDINKIAIENPDLYLAVQKTMFYLIDGYERQIHALARHFSQNENVVVLGDRGRMDVKAYIDKRGFYNLLDDASVNEHEICAEYDAVVHMVTAAKGAEEFYTLANNKARRETLEEAKAADDRTLDAWKNHSHLTIIDNYHSTDFEHKTRRLLQAVLNILGIPQPVETERKFLLFRAPNPNIPELQGTQKSIIEQIYLTNPPEEELRIRKRSFDNFTLYFETRKRKITTGVRLETEEIINAEKYASLAKKQDPNTIIIRKTRRCFIYKDRRFELDVFLNPFGTCLLEVELADMEEKVELPPFLEIVREVTDDPMYSNRVIAQKY